VRLTIGATLRDLRSLARGRLAPTVAEWDQRNFGHLSAMQGEATLLPAAQVAAGLSLGGEIIRLRRIAHRFTLDAELARAMAAIANGDSATHLRTRPPAGRKPNPSGGVHAPVDVDALIERNRALVALAEQAPPLEPRGSRDSAGSAPRRQGGARQNREGHAASALPVTVRLLLRACVRYSSSTCPGGFV
jgi:hypothetical protein